MNILSYRVKDGRWLVPFCVPDSDMDALVNSQSVLCKNYDMAGVRLYRLGRFENGALVSSKKIIWRNK